MALTPEEHEALVNDAMKSPDPLVAKWGELMKPHVSKKWPPPKVVKKKPPTEHWHDLAKPDPLIPPLEYWEKVSDAAHAWDTAQIEYVDAEVDYPIVEDEVKVPMQTRRSNKRVGLTCKAVQLLSKKLDQTCCSDCHDFTRRREDHHSMQWVSTPAKPEGFDVGQAYVCCRYRKICSTATTYGWDKLANEGEHLDPAHIWGKLINDAAGCGSHMSKVVDLTWLTSVPIFDGVVLAKMGLAHTPTLRVQVKSAFTSAAAVPEEFCINPRCVTCAWDNSSYWSYQLQCWLRYNLYSIFDNTTNLTKTHQTLTNHSCGGTNHNSTIWIPEYLLWTCRYEAQVPNTDKLPVWGAQYDVNPKYHAAMKWWDADDYDFRWIQHTPDKDSAPELSAPYQFLVWEVVGL